MKFHMKSQIESCGNILIMILNQKIIKLEQKINQKIETNKKDEEFNNYIKIAETALENNDLEKANENLMLAKNIKSNQQIDLLENKINLLESELKKKEDDTKRNDVYNRYFNFARSYYQDGNYAKALEQVRKAKKIKEKAKMEAQTEAQIFLENAKEQREKIRVTAKKKFDGAINSILNEILS